MPTTLKTAELGTRERHFPMNSDTSGTPDQAHATMLGPRTFWFVHGAWWLLGQGDEPIAYGETPFPLPPPCLN